MLSILSAICPAILLAAASHSPAAPVTEPARAPAAKIVIVAGVPSHGRGEHEFNAGTRLLADWLKALGGIDPVVVQGGWPADSSVFDGAKAVVFYLNGGDRHPMIVSKDRMDTMKRLMGKGVGLACLHYAVEYPKGEFGDQLLEWLGGYYETGYSTNPINETLITPKPDHPIASGVPTFVIKDEWYYRIRFRPNDPRVTPILTTNLPKETPQRETVAWATERKDGGRSFGFTGGHYHVNWGNADFRKLVLNAILWIAKMHVPSEGAASSTTPEDIARGWDPKP